jgi:urease accessory protein
LEGFTHQASFIYLDEKAKDVSISNTVQEYLSLQKEVIFGITSAPVNGWLIRLLGYKAEQLHDCLKEVNQIITTAIHKKEITSYAS